MKWSGVRSRIKKHHSRLLQVLTCRHLANKWFHPGIDGLSMLRTVSRTAGPINVYFPSFTTMYFLMLTHDRSLFWEENGHRL
jgi:hypothetical protein